LSSGICPIGCTQRIPEITKVKRFITFYFGLVLIKSIQPIASRAG
jgi:hypothetical protein